MSDEEEEAEEDELVSAAMPSIRSEFLGFGGPPKFGFDEGEENETKKKNGQRAEEMLTPEEVDKVR